MINNTYIIPTNKECTKYLKSILAEISFVEEKYNLFFYVVILDSATPNDYSKNHAYLKNVKFKNSKLLHICSQLLDDDITYNLNRRVSNNIIKLVTGNEFSYGKMNNKISIIANILGTDYIHRRDSDVALQYYNNNIVSPLEVEILTFLNTKNIFMVGSSYIGDWGIDYKKYEDDLDLLLKLFALSKPNYSERELHQYIKEKYIYGCRDNYNGKDDISFKKSNYIDAGNFSIYKIFKYYPVPPAIGVSGTDYFYHFILNNLEKSKIFHNRRVLHKYSEDRYQITSNNTYDLSKLYSRVFTQYNNEVLDIMTQNKNNVLNKQPLISAYQKTLQNKKVLNNSNDIISRFKEVYIDNYIGDIDFIKNIDNYKVIKKIELDVKEFIILIENWSLIMQNTKKISLKKYYL